MRHETRLSFEYATPQRARRVERAIAPEVGAIADDRSETSIERSGEVLALVVEAADLVALRAGVNTWCSLVSVAERTGNA